MVSCRHVLEQLVGIDADLLTVPAQTATQRCQMSRFAASSMELLFVTVTYRKVKWRVSSSAYRIFIWFPFNRDQLVVMNALKGGTASPLR